MTSPPRIVICCAAAGLFACGEDITQVTEQVAFDGQVLVSSTEEPAGENCAAGGTLVSIGLDTNADGVLNADEVDSTSYVCGAETVEIPPVPVTSISEEPAGDNCPDGGLRSDAGLDENRNGVLDDDEIATTDFVCTDLPGTQVLAVETFIGGGHDNCPGGYLRTDMGVDVDESGALEESEITITNRACNATPTLLTTTVEASCGEAISVQLEAIDPDGGVRGFALSGTDPAGFELSEDGVLTLGEGENRGWKRVDVVVVDEHGATSTTTLTVAFAAGTCPTIPFFGVDPTSCIEVETDPQGGDDRAGVILVGEHLFFVGDDALVRTDRTLETRVPVVEGEVDSLFSDGETLYTLWSSAFTSTNLVDAVAADEELSDAGTFDMVATVNPVTLEVTPGAALDFTISTSSVDWSRFIPETAGALSISRVAIGAAEGELVVAMNGSDPVTAEQIVTLEVFSLDTGERTSVGVIDGTDEAYNDFRFNDPETNLFTSATYVRDGAIVIVLENSNWVEIDPVALTSTLASETFADDCDLSSVAYDPVTLTVSGRSEDGCFGTYANEAVWVCQALTEFNPDGAIDDSGDGD